MKLVLMLAVAGALCAFQPDPAMLRKLYEEALSRRERDYGPADSRTAQACRDLGYYLRGAGDNKAAFPFLQRAVRIDEANYGPQARQTLADVAGLASVAPSAQAELLLRRAMTATDAQISGSALATLGDLHLTAGDKGGAAKYFRLALAKAEAAFGKDGPMVGTILNTLASVVEPKEAIPLLDRALSIAKNGWGDPHPETATTQVNLARALLRAGRTGEAAALARQGLTAMEATLGPQHPRTAGAARALADTVAAADPSEAERLYTRALAIDRLALGEQDQQTLTDDRALTALRKARATKGR